MAAESPYTALVSAKIELNHALMLGDYTLLRECIVSFPADAVPFVRLSDTATVVGCLFLERGPVPPGGLGLLKWDVPPGCRLERADGSWLAR